MSSHSAEIYLQGNSAPYTLLTRPLACRRAPRVSSTTKITTNHSYTDHILSDSQHSITIAELMAGSQGKISLLNDEEKRPFADARGRTETYRNTISSGYKPHYTNPPPPLTEPAKLEDSLHNKLGHIMLPRHPANMAPSDSDQMSEMKWALGLARTPSIDWNDDTRTCHMESETPNERQFKGGYNNQEASDNGYTSSFMAPQAQDAAPVDNPTRQEIAGSNEDGDAVRGSSQKAPQSGDIPESNTPVAEEAGLDPLVMLADMAAKQEYIGTWPLLKDPPVPVTVATTPKASLTALLPPSPSRNPESKGIEDIRTKEQQPTALLSPSPSKSPESRGTESAHTNEPQPTRRENPTPPRSHKGTESSQSSEEDTSQAAQELVLAQAQATQRENSLTAEKSVLVAPQIEWKYPHDHGHKRDPEAREAARILLTLRYPERVRIDLTQDGPSAPSVSRNLCPMVGRSAWYTSHNNPPVKEMSTEQFNTFLDNRHSPNDSDSDTIDDPGCERRTECAELPESSQ
jgi:hypothetical protein